MALNCSVIDCGNVQRLKIRLLLLMPRLNRAGINLRSEVDRRGRSIETGWFLRSGQNTRKVCFCIRSGAREPAKFAVCLALPDSASENKEWIP